MTTEACIRMSKESGVAAALKQFGEIPRVRLPMSGDFLSKSIEDLPLSVRSRNALMRAGLYTVDKLTDFIKENAGQIDGQHLPFVRCQQPELVVLCGVFQRIRNADVVLPFIFRFRRHVLCRGYSASH